VEEDFGVGVPLYVVGSPVKLLNYGFLLFNAGDPVQSVCKIQLFFG